MLLSSGAKLDHKGSDGQTALMLACGIRYLPAVKFQGIGWRILIYREEIWQIFRNHAF